MRAEKARSWLVSTTGSVLVVVAFSVNEVVCAEQKVPAVLNTISLPSFQNLLSKIGSFNRWWIIAGLAIAIGFGGFLYFVMRLRRTLKRVDDELTTLRDLNSLSNAAQPDLEILKSELSEEVGKELQKLEMRIQNLDSPEGWIKSKIKELEQKVKELEPKASGSEEAYFGELPDKAVIDEILSASAATRPPGQISIEEMLEWAKEAGLLLKPVKATLGLFGNFSPSDEGDNWLAENGGRDGGSFLFPRSERFETAAHYDMYRLYYNCVHPAAGRIVIESPAMVEIDSEQGGWKLSTKGELSVIP